jgi:hypothetical protein
MPEARLLRDDSKLLMPGVIHTGQTSAARRAHCPLLNGWPLQEDERELLLECGHVEKCCLHIKLTKY